MANRMDFDSYRSRTSPYYDLQNQTTTLKLNKSGRWASPPIACPTLTPWSALTRHRFVTGNLIQLEPPWSAATWHRFVTGRLHQHHYSRPTHLINVACTSTRCTILSILCEYIEPKWKVEVPCNKAAPGRRTPRRFELDETSCNKADAKPPRSSQLPTHFPLIALRNE